MKAGQNVAKGFLIPLFFILGLLYCLDCFSQIRKDTTSSIRKKITTEIFWLDLCKPSELTTLTKSSGRGRLEVKWKDVLSFGLKNTNQFKYDYKLNSVPFASFVDTSYASFATTVKSAIDLTPDPNFIFVITAKSPNKLRYILLSSERDSLNDVLNDKLVRLDKVHSDYSFSYYDYPAKTPQVLKENSKVYEEYIQVRNEYDKTFHALDKVKSSLNEILSLQNQKRGLEYNIKKLINIAEDVHSRDFLNDLLTNLESLPANFYEISNKRGGDDGMSDELRNQLTLLDTYQQSSQLIKTFFGRFEIEYDSIKNYLLSEECKTLTADQKANVNNIIKNFQETKEILFSIQSLYVHNPLENKYLEEYFIAADKYGEFLSKKFMSLQKIININEIYIIPTSSNMKNFDLITLELEKTNKLTNHLEKYNYDIFIKGGLKVDFSAGIFGTTLINNLYYTIDSLDSAFLPTNKKMIRRENNGKMNVGFGGMVNITQRTGASWLAPGLSFGLILSTLPSLQFTSGLTMSLGKTERLLIHGGYAFGFVKRLDDGLKIEEYHPSILIGSNVHTIDKFLVKPFFGLSYNLSKNKVFQVSSFNTSSGSNSPSSPTGGDE